MRTPIAILAACVLSLTMAGCSDDDAANAIPGDVKAVVDAYSASWNDYDAEAFNAVVTDDYMFINTTVGRETTKEQQAASMDTLERVNWNAEQVGDGISAGDGPWFVAISNALTGTNSDGAAGISVVTVVDDGGVLKVLEHIYTGTQP